MFSGGYVYVLLTNALLQLALEKFKCCIGDCSLSLFIN
jgi:hypothetical protein